MESCPFCAIVKKQLPTETVYEDEYALAFRDIRPQAPVHVLIVPKEHVACADDVSDPLLWGRLMNAVKNAAAKSAERLSARYARASLLFRRRNTAAIAETA